MGAVKSDLATEMQQAIRDLQRAAYAAESAADDAEAAIEELKSLASGNVTHDCKGSEISRAVMRLHDERHDELAQYCTEACRLAWEEL